MSKFLVIGTGDSAIHYTKMDIKIGDHIKIIGMHRAFPYFREEVGLELDYWTWSDPDASLEGLRVYMSTPKEKLDELPQIVLPYYQKTLGSFNVNCGTSPLQRNPKRGDERKFYNESVQYLDECGKIDWIENAINTKIIPIDHPVFTDPLVRFDGRNTYFGTVPFDGRDSWTQWAQENKFTSYMLPIVHYLGAMEVFCLGFDNAGLGIGRKVPFMRHNQRTILTYLSKYLKWTHDWVGYHKMNIYNLAEDNFTPNNFVMKYLPIGRMTDVKYEVPQPFIVRDDELKKYIDEAGSVTRTIMKNTQKRVRFDEKFKHIQLLLK